GTSARTGSAGSRRRPPSPGSACRRSGCAVSRPTCPTRPSTGGGATSWCRCSCHARFHGRRLGGVAGEGQEDIVEARLPQRHPGGGDSLGVQRPEGGEEGAATVGHGELDRRAVERRRLHAERGQGLEGHEGG